MTFGSNEPLRRDPIGADSMRHIHGDGESAWPRWIAAIVVTTVLTIEAAAALDIDSRPVRELDGPNATRLRLVLSGQVRAGDTLKLERVLATLPLQQFDGVVLNSPGGSSFEGFQIAQLLEHLLVRVIVREPFRCVSACFTMYAGAAMRGAQGPPYPATLGVHRGALQAHYADQLSDEALERLLEFEQNEKPRWFAERGVPASIIGQIVAGAVAPVVVLSQQDIDDMGPRSPRYDRWIEARCPGSGKVAAWTVRELPPQVADGELAHAEERRQCEATRVEAERRYRQFALQTALDAAERRNALRQPHTPPRVDLWLPGR